MPRIKVEQRGTKVIGVLLMQFVDIYSSHNLFDLCDRFRNGFCQISRSAFGHANVVQLLLDTHHPVDAVNHFGFTPAKLAAKYGKAEVVNLMSEDGAEASNLISGQ